MSNLTQLQQFFKHVAPLFQSDAPKVAEIINPEIETLNSLVEKLKELDLTTSAYTILSGVSSGTPIGSVVAIGAVSVKAAALAQGVEVTEEEANLISQALTKWTANTANTFVGAAQAIAA